MQTVAAASPPTAWACTVCTAWLILGDYDERRRCWQRTSGLTDRWRAVPASARRRDWHDLLQLVRATAAPSTTPVCACAARAVWLLRGVKCASAAVERAARPTDGRAAAARRAKKRQRGACQSCGGLRCQLQPPESSVLACWSATGRAAVPRAAPPRAVLRCCLPVTPPKGVRWAVDGDRLCYRPACRAVDIKATAFGVRGRAVPRRAAR
jgi:hypothetical protein